ncbi:endo-1,3(4)-beta-glucanase-like protein [Pyrenochaeta sp. MPI-SDFR-AT-0127]|nr:endo-1,3(4)-beta-glucanase-like protein [Pyrenochaeta sp. MPI-SDFR-AT-0127]
MSFRTIILCLPFLWRSSKAHPAGPGFWPNGTSSSTSDVYTSAAYALIDTYDASNWISKFDVQAIPDPTHGFVEYVNAQQAQQLGLLKAQGNQIYMGVDTWSTLNPNGPGRKSVRIQSKTAYNRALVIADFAHVPGSNCGSWPAFWMVGPNWPNQGELDIYEGVHLNTYNQVTLHTSPGCTPSVGAGGETGRRVANADCGAGGGYNGCGVMSNSATSYGTAFNANGGGVYASLWTSSGIKVWYFASRDVPGNIRSGNPDPNSWGTPVANFGGCDFDAKFRNMNIVFDITFCGDWAGGVWGSSSCSQMNPSCNAYVASQPQSFADSYWLVNSVKVYSV